MVLSFRLKCVVFLALVCAICFAHAAAHHRDMRLLYECGQNVKEINDAIDQFAAKHGSYPDRLSQLIPAYLPSIPTCPIAHVDTYSATWKHRAGQTAHIYCTTPSHTITASTPWFSRDIIGWW
jgi:hypothetical protein